MTCVCTRRLLLTTSLDGGSVSRWSPELLFSKAALCADAKMIAAPCSSSVAGGSLPVYGLAATSLGLLGVLVRALPSRDNDTGTTTRATWGAVLRCACWTCLHFFLSCACPCCLCAACAHCSTGSWTPWKRLLPVLRYVVCLCLLCADSTSFMTAERLRARKGLALWCLSHSGEIASVGSPPGFFAYASVSVAP